MSYTNVSIPNFNSSNKRLRDQVEHLKLDLEIEQKKTQDLENILNNIPDAIRDHGYVDIRDDNGKLLVTAVAKVMEQGQ